ncbi:Rv3235 family protein [Curtobacterium sp. MCBD17_030]|uniref:Rv3235 family protein n=1 Tax=Curtobacterium sp. MCBD17_030 TaxID=2175649 RepID=UPI0011B55AAB|nr:Rv3235 family protein [Curtobacterium sp. MCBD17_030]
MKGAGVAENARRIEDEPDGHGADGRLGRRHDDRAEHERHRGRLENGPPRTMPPGLPDPGETARSLALCVAEILTGAREVETISRWITEEVQRHLQHRAAVAARARSAARRRRHRPLIRVGSVVVSVPRDGVAEAAVVVHTRSHARAVAIRLEERRGRWRATAIGVL